MSQLVERSYAFRADSSGDGDGRTLSGYVAVWDEEAAIYEDGRSFSESIERGAFSDSLSKRTPILCYGHGRDPLVGSLPIGTFTELREDEHGLRMTARLIDTPRVNEVAAAISSGSITGCSFRFAVEEDDWPSRDRRVLKRVDIRECGPVAEPAYLGTSVGVRSASTAGLTRGQRARQLREHALRALDLALAKPKPEAEEEPVTLDQAVEALALVAKYFEHLKSEESGGSSEPPPPTP
jgi:HK97 family phage prohead protease